MNANLLAINQNVNQPADTKTIVVNGKKEDPQKLKKACEDFESIFTYYLLKNMRNTIPNSTKSNTFTGKDTYNTIMDQKIAENLSHKGKGLGLSKILFEQLTKNYSKEVPK
jgi:peptidoglycan hydrolase FlgJ